MSRYSDVLEQQESIRRHLASPDSWNIRTSLAVSLLGHDPRDRAQVEALLGTSLYRQINKTLETTYGGMLKAPPYWVDRPICRMLGQAAESIPSWTLRREMLPTISGYVMFAEPFELSTGATFHGMAWVPAGEHEDGTLPKASIGAADSTITGLTLTFFVASMESGWRVVPSGISYVRDGTDQDRALESATDPDQPIQSAQNMMQKMNLFAAFCLFIEQRLLVSAPTPPQRPTRRRLEQTYHGHVPDVLVIRLRRTSYGRHDSDYNERHVEWACQWLVGGDGGGYWNYYWSGPNRSVKVPRWILPHWKGPQDAPIRVRNQRLFQVDR